MDGASKVRKFELDPESVKGGMPVPLGKRILILRNFEILNGIYQCSLPDILDALAAAAYNQIHHIRIEIRRAGNVAITIRKRLGSRKHRNIGHGEGDSHRGSFQRRFHDTIPLHQLGRAGHRQDDGSKICDQSSHHFLSPHTNSVRGFHCSSPQYHES